MWDKGRNSLFLQCFTASWQALHIEKLSKCMTKYIPIWVHGYHPPISSTTASHHYFGWWHNNGDTTMTRNEVIFGFPNNPGRDQALSLLYLPLCTSKWPVSSASCRLGALIFSCVWTAMIVETPLVRTNAILMVVNITFEKNQQKTLNVWEDGGWEGRNATIKWRREGTGGMRGGTQVSINLSTLFAHVPSMYSRYTCFIWFSLQATDRGHGLSIAQGRRSKGKVWLFFFPLLKYNIIVSLVVTTENRI